MAEKLVQPEEKPEPFKSVTPIRYYAIIAESPFQMFGFDDDILMT